MNDKQWVADFLDSLSPEVRNAVQRQTAKQAARLAARNDLGPPSCLPIREPLRDAEHAAKDAKI